MENLFRAAKAILRKRASHTGQAPASPPSGRALLETAFRLHQSGRLAEALPLYRNVIELDPDSDVAHNLLGALLCSQGQLSDGEACFRKALDINAANAEALNNLASSRKEQGDLSGAETFYRRALEARPDFAAGWNNLGLVYMARARPDDAERCFRRATAADAHNADAHNNLGTVLRSRGLLAEAETEFRAAITANPGLAEAWCGLADILQAGGLLDEAEACCRKALELRPGDPDATNNLATIAKARGRLDMATAHCDDVLRIHPEHVGALNNLGSIAMRRGDHGSAEATYRRAMRIDPGRAVTRYNLAMTLLMRGEYGEGLDLYESRFEALPELPTRSRALNERLQSRPQWRGEALGRKRLLVWAEQGLGDCIMMLRYLPSLRERGVDSVTVSCDAAMRRLVEAMSVAERVIAMDEGVESLEFDVHCPMMSLPRAFGSHLDTIPDRVPYLAVPRSMVSSFAGQLSKGAPKVGVAWAGSRTLRDDARRSIPLASFAPLLSLEEVQFVSLQKGDAAGEWRKLGRDGSECIDGCNDFLETAALVMNLDLVISVDTAVAHLAGALGRPVWLLNRFGSEWRWGLSREDSPWYPTMKIFRQPYEGAWDAVIETIRGNCLEFLRIGNRGRAAPTSADGKTR